MIQDWESDIYWSKKRSWEDNEITRQLVELVGEDFAVKFGINIVNCR